MIIEGKVEGLKSLIVFLVFRLSSLPVAAHNLPRRWRHVVCHIIIVDRIVHTGYLCPIICLQLLLHLYTLYRPFSVLLYFRKAGYNGWFVILLFTRHIPKAHGRVEIIFLLMCCHAAMVCFRRTWPFYLYEIYVRIFTRLAPTSCCSCGGYVVGIVKLLVVSMLGK